MEEREQEVVDAAEICGYWGRNGKLCAKEKTSCYKSNNNEMKKY